MFGNVGALKIAQCTAVVSSALWPNGQGVVLQLGLGLGLGVGPGDEIFPPFFVCVEM